MSRHKRFLPPDTPAHLVQRAVDRQTIFRDPTDFRAFLDLLGEAASRHAVRLFGYCLMPNHWHLLAQSPEPGEISRYMKWLAGTHALRYRRFRGTVGHGHVYQDRFWGGCIEGEMHFFSVLRYIEANAARARLVEYAEDWPWSSAWERMTGERQLLARLPTELPRNWYDLLNREASALLLRVPEGNAG